MADKGAVSVKASGEQLTYANILNKGMLVGILILLITYAIYLSGILPTFIPVEDVPKLWTKSVKDFTHELDVPTGWGWLKMVGTGYFVNFIGIVMLAAITVLCYLSILPGLIRKKDTPLVIIVILEVLVLVFAASGILKSGGH